MPPDADPSSQSAPHAPPAPVQADRLTLLAEVGRIADGTLLLGETVQQLLDLIVPAFADVATLDVVAATGEMRRLGARVADPQRAEMEAALLRRHQSGDRSIGVLRTIATGESQLLSPMPDRALQTISTSAADLDLLRSLRLRSTMYVPLRARGRTLGALACSTARSGRTFSAADVQFAEVLSSRIGMALDNAGLSETVSGLERRLEVTLAHLAAAVLVRDADGRLVFANPAAAELLGVGTVERLFATSAEQLMTLFEPFDERGRPLSLQDLPSTRALHGERPAPLVVRSTVRATGRVRWLLHKATPVFDSDGTLSLAVNIIEDITEAKRAELAQRLLAEAGKELASSLDYQQTLRRVARLAVPELADWCGVSIRGPGDALQQVAVAHTDPAKVALAREFGQRYPTRVDSAGGAARVLRTGRAEFVPMITDDLLAGMRLTPEQLRLVRDLGMRSVVIVPLAIPGRAPFGTLTLVMAESGRTFDEDDLAVAEELGRRAATAVENARLYTERSRIATSLQQSLLPPTLPVVPGFQMDSLYRPAGAHSDVGGDFYDAFAIPQGWMVVVGDVTGHGPEAAALTSLARYTLRTAARLLDDPVAAVAHLNAALLERPQLSLVSLCCAVLRDHGGETSADVVLAGHPPPYHVSAGRAHPVGAPAQLLGIDEAGRWTTGRVVLRPDDLLVLFTDGVIDTVGEHERFGEERLAATLGAATDAADVIARVDATLSAFGRGPQRDDLAVLAVHRVATPPRGGGGTADGSAAGLVVAPRAPDTT